MPSVVFKPMNAKVEVPADSKILAVACHNKIPIRFGCGSCRCGTCAVAVEVRGKLNEPKDDEVLLLKKLGLQVDGSVRLSCRARILEGEVLVDLDFQKTYNPPPDDEEYPPLSEEDLDK